MAADAGGAVGVEHGGLLGFGEFGGLRRIGLGGRGERDGDVLEPVAGALHGGGVRVRLGLLAHSLRALEGVEAASLLTHHGAGLGTEAAGVVEVLAGEVLHGGAARLELERADVGVSTDGVNGWSY